MTDRAPDHFVLQDGTPTSLSCIAAELRQLHVEERLIHRHILQIRAMVDQYDGMLTDAQDAIAHLQQALDQQQIHGVTLESLNRETHAILHSRSTDGRQAYALIAEANARLSRCARLLQDTAAR